MNVVTYDPNNRFDITQCIMCLEEYEENERIAELACKHLYHIQCQEAFVRCPLCRTEIAGRTVLFNREEWESEVTALIQQLPQVIRLSSPIRPETIQSVVNLGIEHPQNAIMQHPYINALLALKQINSDLRKIIGTTEEEREAVINRHAFYLIEKAVLFLPDRPLNETYSLKEIAGVIDGLCMVIFKERFVKEYIQPLIKAVAESSRLIEVIQNRDMQFKNAAELELQSMSIWQQCRRIKQYTPRQLEIIADLGVANTALKIVSTSRTCTKIARVAIMLGTLCYITEPEGTRAMINAATELFRSCISNANLL